MDFDLYNKRIHIVERLIGDRAENVRLTLVEAGAENVLIYDEDHVIVMDTNLSEIQLMRILSDCGVTIIDVCETTKTPDV